MEVLNKLTCLYTTSNKAKLYVVMFIPIALHAELDNFSQMKLFICLSTVMTWARSKPLDPVSEPGCIEQGRGGEG